MLATAKEKKEETCDDELARFTSGFEKIPAALNIAHCSGIPLFTNKKDTATAAAVDM